MTAPAIVWLRQDLRLSDNLAVRAAHDSGRPLLFLYVLDEVSPGVWRPGGASRWWLHGSLTALGADIERRGGALILRRGDADAVVPAFVAETQAAEIHWTRLYEPYATARDAKIKEELKRAGVKAHSWPGAVLHEPFDIKTNDGGPYKVYSPFARAAHAKGLNRSPASAPERLSSPSALPPSDPLDAWGLLPTTPDWAGGLRETWTPGEAGAAQRLDAFIAHAAQAYSEDRNRPDKPSTSRLSPHLHFGEISPLQVWAALENAKEAKRGLTKGVDKALSEVLWREFSYHLLYHFPSLPEKNWRDNFDNFPWRRNDQDFMAWRRGRTGYPMVDAGMRELWATGWMHNRVRMVTASFLIKHLMIHWREGADWFWDTLVDADLANNSASWQWVAGSGADAAPYFRIFNPVSQGESYDPDGAYVRRWVPELARLPNHVIHKPWEASKETLRAAGITLGQTYPHPIVDHAMARARALSAFEGIRSTA